MTKPSFIFDFFSVSFVFKLATDFAEGCDDFNAKLHEAMNSSSNKNIFLML